MKRIFGVWDDQNDEYFCYVDSLDTARKAIWDKMTKEYTFEELQEFASEAGYSDLEDFEKAIQNSTDMCNDYDYYIEQIDIKTGSDF